MLLFEMKYFPKSACKSILLLLLVSEQQTDGWGFVHRHPILNFVVVSGEAAVFESIEDLESELQVACTAAKNFQLQHPNSSPRPPFPPRPLAMTALEHPTTPRNELAETVEVHVEYTVCLFLIHAKSHRGI